MSEKIVQLNEEVIKGQIKELVRGSVDETLGATVKTGHPALPFIGGLSLVDCVEHGSQRSPLVCF
ncbi:hypothetical protein [Oscillibacter sp.]|uniref:hypothetical protein n=1 Tax=Oscillibacter sp. TaxID=1945593 RepID=UPI002898C4E8|nr:hypothetical protein [Oscillibacter sp.]